MGVRPKVEELRQGQTIWLVSFGSDLMYDVRSVLVGSDKMSLPGECEYSHVYPRWYIRKKLWTMWAYWSRKRAKRKAEMMNRKYKEGL